MFDPHDPVFWVTIAFLLFVALLVYYGVPDLIGKALDKRADAIRAELEQAKRLREEAQALLADYQRKAKEAEIEAKKIVEEAQREADALATASAKALKESLDRRAKLAEEKIARAEAQAVNEVKAAAIEAAVGAAEKILTARAASNSDALIGTAISTLKSKLN